MSNTTAARGIAVGLVVAGVVAGGGIAMASGPSGVSDVLAKALPGSSAEVPELRVTTADYPMEVRRLHESGDGAGTTYPPNSTHEADANHTGRFEFFVNGNLVTVHAIEQARTLICTAGGTKASPTVDCAY